MTERLLSRVGTSISSTERSRKTELSHGSNIDDLPDLGCVVTRTVVLVTGFGVVVSPGKPNTLPVGAESE